MTSTESPRSHDRFADELRGFGPVGIVVTLVILLVGNYPVPIGVILVLLWMRQTQTPWRDIGYVWPVRWAGTVAVGIVFGVAFKFLMKAIVMPLLGANPVNEAYHYLAGNRAALPLAIYGMIVGAGFGEETVYRGYLFERLGKLLPPRAWTGAAIVAITTALFAAAHYQGQGRDGAVQAIFTGLVFGTIRARTGRVWLPMVAHAAFDLTAVGLIYLDLESTVAHLVFK